MGSQGAVKERRASLGQRIQKHVPRQARFDGGGIGDLYAASPASLERPNKGALSGAPCLHNPHLPLFRLPHAHSQPR